MAIQTIQNNSVTFDITPYLNSRGWSLVDNKRKAQHTSENEGYLEFPNYSVKAGNSYTYSVNVESISGGYLQVQVGEANSPNITSSGYHQGTLTAISDGIVKAFSNANLTMGRVDISLTSNNSIALDNNTITWNEDRDKWITFKSFIPEGGFNMFTNLFTIKNGLAYKHTSEAIPNNFYGTQYSSKVKFQLSNSVGVKTYHSMAIHANKVIGTTENGIETELGNISDLVSFDFDTKEGIHYANKLRDVILNEKLKGRYIVIELTDEESNSTKLQIFKIVVKGEISSPNE